MLHAFARMVALALCGALLTGFTYPQPPIQPPTGPPSVEETFSYKNTTLRVQRSPGLRAVPLEWVQYALAHHSYPHKSNQLIGEEFPIFLTDRQIRMDDIVPLAVAGSDGFILFGGVETPDRTTVEEAVLHELGHQLAFRTMGPQQWEAYRKLRQLPPAYSAQAPWENRPAEVFAEDFAYLFGTGQATRLPWRLGELPEPWLVLNLREFFLRLVEDPRHPEETATALALRDGNLPISRVEWVYELFRAIGGSVAGPFSLPTDWMVVPRWSRQAVQVFVSNGWIQGYPDGSFHPDEPITRAQAAEVLLRMLRLGRGPAKVEQADATAWPDWGREAIESVQSQSLMPALAAGRFAPNEPLTKGDTLLVLERIEALLSQRAAAANCQDQGPGTSHYSPANPDKRDRCLT